MKMRKKIKAKKVPVMFLLGMLSELYAAGVEFVDVVIEREEGEDSLGIIVNENYSASEGTSMEGFNGKNINDLIA